MSNILTVTEGLYTLLYMSRYFSRSLNIILIGLTGIMMSCQRNESRKVSRVTPNDTPQKTYHFDNTQGCFAEGIVNGTVATSANPLNSHLVMILTRFQKDLSPGSEVLSSLCTGTLVGPNTVLTAAHCFPKNRMDSQIVASINLYCSSGFTRRLVYNVTKTNIHPLYRFKDAPSAASPDYDLATVEFEGVLPGHYSPLKVARPDIQAERANPSSQMIMIGYGRTSTHDESLPELRFVSKSWDQLVLQKNSLSLIDQMNLVAVNQTDGRGGCSGDSGGPLLAVDKNGYRVMGVASYIESASDNRLCEQGQIYYSYLSSYWDWLSYYLP